MVTASPRRKATSWRFPFGNCPWYTQIFPKAWELPSPNIRQTAKELHIPEKLFTYLLVEMGFAYRTLKRLLMPYAFMVTSGFAELKEYTNGKHGGVYMLFTPIGRLYLHRKISKRLEIKAPTESEQG